jgi:hypothetical protein
MVRICRKLPNAGSAEFEMKGSTEQPDHIIPSDYFPVIFNGFLGAEAPRTHHGAPPPMFLQGFLFPIARRLVGH